MKLLDVKLTDVKFIHVKLLDLKLVDSVTYRMKAFIGQSYNKHYMKINYEASIIPMFSRFNISWWSLRPLSWSPPHVLIGLHNLGRVLHPDPPQLLRVSVQPHLRTEQPQGSLRQHHLSCQLHKFNITAGTYVDCCVTGTYVDCC